jgi:hypothetical protein
MKIPRTTLVPHWQLKTVTHSMDETSTLILVRDRDQIMVWSQLGLVPNFLKTRLVRSLVFEKPSKTGPQKP